MSSVVTNPTLPARPRHDLPEEEEEEVASDGEETEDVPRHIQRAFAAQDLESSARNPSLPIGIEGPTSLEITHSGNEVQQDGSGPSVPLNLDAEGKVLRT